MMNWKFHRSGGSVSPSDTPLHADKAHIFEVIQVNPAESREASLRKSQAESSHCAVDTVDGTTKDVILSDPPE